MQQQKFSVSKRFLSVEEVAKELNVKKFLIKFWEKEFKVNLERTNDSNRCYSQENLKSFVAIKDLVHNKKMSLSQAKKQLNNQDSFVAAEQELPQIDQPIDVCQSDEQLTVQPATTPTEDIDKNELFRKNLQLFREQLINFKQLLDLD